MKRFKTVFRRPVASDTPDTPGPASTRRPWRRNTVKPQPETTTTETTETTETADTGPESSSAQRKPAISSVAAVGNDDGDDAPHSTHHPTEDTSEVSRSKFGTKRLKRLVTRFRSSDSDDPVAQPSQPEETGSQDVPREQPAGGPLSSNPFDVPISPTDTRPLSARKSHSRQSSQSDDTIGRNPPDTIPRLPEDRLRMSLDEDVPEWMWSGMINIPEEGTRIRQYSDPFADGKSSEYQQPGPDARPQHSPLSDPTPGPSRRPHRSQESSRTSEGPLQPIPEAASTHSQDQIHTTDEAGLVATGSTEAGSTEKPQPEPAHGIKRARSGAFSAGSDYSAGSLPSLTPYSAIAPSSAINNFNHMALQHGINLRIASEETPSPEMTSPTSGKGKEAERSPQRGAMGRLRNVRSNVEIPSAHRESSPKPMLRRIKTIANIFHTDTAVPPLTSLKGRPVEELSLFGGHSYLIANELGPGVMELPAFMVAAFKYLHIHGAGITQVFLEAGDVALATRFYNDWAEGVVDGAKMLGDIDLNTRVVAMPALGEHGSKLESSVLSVGWALKAVLAGLPTGILGSIRLYQTLHDLFAITIPEKTGFKIPDHIQGVTSTIAIRVQLITHAIFGLTTEQQRDLICATFGLLTYLLHPPRSSQPLPSRSDVRWPTAPPNPQELARVFAPLLLGQENRPVVIPGNEKVEMEFEEERVANLLLDHWPNVQRQMQVWLQEPLIPRH